jgi:hypothetical protein
MRDPSAENQVENSGVPQPLSATRVRMAGDGGTGYTALPRDRLDAVIELESGEMAQKPLRYADNSTLKIRAMITP